MEISVGKPQRNRREAWEQAKGLAGKPERNRERQRPSLSRTAVVLAGSRPAEKLDLSMYKHILLSKSII